MTDRTCLRSGDGPGDGRRNAPRLGRQVADPVIARRAISRAVESVGQSIPVERCPRFDAQPGSLRKPVTPGRAGHRRVDVLDVAIEDRRLVLVHRAVGERRGDLQARREEDADADGRVRDDPRAALPGERGDREELRDARVPHLWLDDRELRARQAHPRLVHAVPFLARGHRQAAFRRDARERVDVLGRAGRLDEPGARRRDTAGHRQRLADRILPVQIDGEVRVRAQRLAQRGHFGGDALVRHRRRVLERAKAAIAPFGGERDALGERRLRQPGDVRGHLRHARSAGQRCERDARLLRREVPQRDVDGGERVAVVAAGRAAHAHEVVQVVVDRRRVARIVPLDDRDQHVAQDRERGPRRDDAVGLAPADRAVGGLGAHDHRHVRGRIDRAVAATYDVALAVDGLAGPEGTEIGDVPRQRDRVRFDRSNRGHRRTGVRRTRNPGSTA